jgi:N-acetylmuramoyl-L-alanine amidase
MKFLIVLAFAALASAQTPCDNIRTRSQWGSRSTSLTWMPSQPPSGFAVHHTFGARCTTQAACDTQMRSIQNFHMNSNGWADIGYNFCVGDPGQIYEGRGFGRQGAHAPGFNARALGHCFFGDHTSVLPTAIALSNTRAFIDCTRARGWLTSGHWVSTHRGDRQSNTACPGNALQNNVATWPRFVANP